MAATDQTRLNNFAKACIPSCTDTVSVYDARCGHTCRLVCRGAMPLTRIDYQSYRLRPALAGCMRRPRDAASADIAAHAARSPSPSNDATREARDGMSTPILPSGKKHALRAP